MMRFLKSRFTVFIERIRVLVQQMQTRLMMIFIIRLLVHTIRGFGDDYGTYLAASIAYYGLLAIFPLLLGLIALLGIFLPSERIQGEIFQTIQTYLPNSAELITSNIEAIIRARGTLGVIAILGLMWTGSSLFAVVSHAVNRAWGVTKVRPFFIKKPRELFMVLAVGFLLLLSMGASTIFTALRDLVPTGANLITEIFSRFFGFLAILALFTLIYRFIPNTKTKWRHVWPGAILAAIFFEILRAVFIIYLTRFTNYELIYGQIASIITLLIWMYFSAIILVLGAEISSEYSRMKEGTGRSK